MHENQNALEQKLQRAAKALEKTYGCIPFYAAKATDNPNYWRHLAS